MARVSPPKPSPAAASRPIRIDVPPPAGLILRTPRMLLRPMEERDREPFLAAVRASRKQLDLCLPLHQPDETDEAMFARQLQLASSAAGECHTAAPWVRLVGMLADGTVAGGFNINTITRGLECKADINWWVAAPLAGKGLATEGLAVILAHALADLPSGLGLHTVHAWITRDNPASARVATKAGLVKAGEERSYISTGGRWVLHDLYTRGVGGVPG